MGTHGAVETCLDCAVALPLSQMGLGQDVKTGEKAGRAVAGKLDGAAMPVRAYLEQSVVPVLMAGMQQVVRERPDDAIEFLGQYLLKNNPKKLQQQNGPPLG